MRECERVIVETLSRGSVKGVLVCWEVSFSNLPGLLRAARSSQHTAS